MRTVARSFLRYLIRRRGLSVLQLLGIACGVAAVVGMTLSARSALFSFSQAVEFLKGKATHSLERPAGPMEETILAALMKDPAVEAFAPVIDRRIRLKNGELIRLLGIDVFLDRHIRPEIVTAYNRSRANGQGREAFAFFLDERTVIIDYNLARRLKLKTGSLLGTSFGDLKVTGLFTNPSGEPIVLMDVGHAQKLFRLEGWIDRIDMVVTDEAAFRSRWGKGFLIQSGIQRSQTFRAMLDAFRLNLEALSLLALFVGVFLIYNTAMFAVVSRKRDAGVLRSLGARNNEVVGAFLLEVLILGLLGGLLGSLLGYGLSRFLTGIVGDTISNLYFFLKPNPLPWSFSIVATGMVLGCLASLLGALFPVREIVGLDPVEAVRGRVVSRRERRSAQRLGLAGVAILAVSAVLLAFTGRYVYIGFAGVFGILIGGSFLTGVVLLVLSGPMRRVASFLWGLPGRVAAGTIRQNLSRTTVAVAAFAIALSLSVGLGSMIGSFRQSLVWWMDTQLRGDLYVGASQEITVPVDFYEEIRRLPGLKGVDPYRNVKITYEGHPVFITAISATVLKDHAKFAWVEGGDRNWKDVEEGQVIISESFARNFNTRSGATIAVTGVDGPVPLRVAAVFYDYTSEHGVIMMDRTLYLRLFKDPTINSLAFFIGEDNPRYREIGEEIRKRAGERGLPVLTRSQLQGNILNVFDATFAVTRSMRVMAIVVAFFGIAGALLTLFMERQREFGIYRALGFSTGQVAGMTLVEGIAMGVVSFLMSTALGTVLAVVLIKVINLHSFNWTIFYHFSFEPYGLALVTALLASLGAAAYPVWKVLRTYPDMQIREE